MKAKLVRKKIFLSSLFFIFGFSGVFIVFGSIAGFGGQLFLEYRIWLTRIGGIFVILFGLFMLNIVKIPFLYQKIQIKAPTFLKKERFEFFCFGRDFWFWLDTVRRAGSWINFDSRRGIYNRLAGCFSFGHFLPRACGTFSCDCRKFREYFRAHY